MQQPSSPDDSLASFCPKNTVVRNIKIKIKEIQKVAETLMLWACLAPRDMKDQSQAHCWTPGPNVRVPGIHIHISRRATFQPTTFSLGKEENKQACLCNGTIIKTLNNRIQRVSRLVNISRCWEGDMSGRTMEAPCPFPLPLPCASLLFGCS